MIHCLIALAEPDKTIKKKRMKEFISAWLLAVLAAFVAGSVAHSQFVLADLEQIGVSISLSSRLSTTFEDLVGLLPGYGAVLAIGFLLAFLLAGWVRNTFHTGGWIFAMAGFVAVLTVFALMYPLMEITLIAGARSMAGLICQCLAGALGGIVFAILKKSKGEVSGHEC